MTWWVVIYEVIFEVTLRVILTFAPSKYYDHCTGQIWNQSNHKWPSGGHFGSIFWRVKWSDYFSCFLTWPLKRSFSVSFFLLLFWPIKWSDLINCSRKKSVFYKWANPRIPVNDSFVDFAVFMTVPKICFNRNRLQAQICLNYKVCY